MRHLRSTQRSQKPDSSPKTSSRPFVSSEADFRVILIPNCFPVWRSLPGSLGQGLSVAAGLAAGLRLKGGDQKVYTVLGDGECEEGQVWEAANFAAAEALGNLVAIVDSNGLQIDGQLCDVCSAGELDEKFAAFGWEVHHVDGHDIDALIALFASLPCNSTGKPQAIIAKTVKGKGVSFMENQVGWHGKAPDAEQTKQALAELESEVDGD